VNGAGGHEPPCFPEMAAVPSGRADAGGRRVLLHNLRLFTGRSHRLRDGQAILLHGPWIHRVAHAGDVEALPGYDRIDMRGRTVLPGLIDGHCHVTVPFMFKVNLATLRQMRRQVALNLRACVMAGVTTVRDLGGFPRQLLARRAQINRGEIPGPRVITALSPIAARRDGELGAPENAPYFTNPLLKRILGGNYAERPRTPAEARAACEAMIALGADWLKTLHQDHAYCALPRPLPNHDDDTFRTILEVGRAHGRRCALHQTRVSGFVKGVDLGFDTLEHIPIDAPLTDAQVEPFVRRRMAIMPTLMALGDVFDEAALLAEVEAPDQAWLVPEAVRQVTAHLRSSLAPERSALGLEDRQRLTSERRYFADSFPNAVANLRTLHRMGATVGVGTDCGGTLTGLFGRYARELRHYVEAGLSATETLCAATAGNADILGIGDRVGTIAVGKLADLIAVDGNPLEDIRSMERVRFVMKGGTVVRNER